MKKSVRSYFAIFCLFFATLSLRAQQDKLYAPGMGLNRYGIAINFTYHRADNTLSKWTKGDLAFELGNITDPREMVQINNTIQNPGIYKFGKINYAWTMRNYYMARRQLSQRQDRKNVAVNALFGAGIPVSYWWPVYILYFDPNAGQMGTTSVVRYDPTIHAQSQIAGRAPFYTGIKQGNFTPGAGINTACEFIWGNYRSDVKILTLGARVEAYSQKIPILYRNDMNKRLFSMFYLNFAFGFGKN